ncbi:condensation domain-containing protein, partial [Streptomyces sp. NRRL S-1868]|uniref:condensation domain-containing protein n=1 Tax=Streptomyces sp. NRRL S-1868 TaxID=1463892 RepID=UPI0004C6A395
MSTQPSRESRISSLPEHMRELLRRRLAGQAPEETGIPRADRGGELPASFAQQRLWFLDEFQPGGVEYNSGLGLRIRGRLDERALRGAVDEVVRRHESLRTTFDAVDGRVVQHVHPSMTVPVERVDVSGPDDDPGSPENDSGSPENDSGSPEDHPGSPEDARGTPADDAGARDTGTCDTDTCDTGTYGTDAYRTDAYRTDAHGTDAHGLDACGTEEHVAAERAARADALLRARLREPFDLRTGPLLRVLLVRLGPEEHALLLSAHHIVTDGWSLGILTRELSALYSAAVRGEGPARLPELPVQYADFAVWQRDRTSDATQEDDHLRYWRRALDGVEPLELPTDRPRRAVRGTSGAVHRFEVPPETVAGLRALERRTEASLFVQLTALTQLLLAHYSGQDDIAVGTVTAGRERPELENLIGFFVNTLVLRTRVDRTAGFEEFLSGVRAHVLEAFDHRETPFDRVVEAVAPERDPGRMPLVQAMVVLQNARAPEVSLAGARVEPLDVARDALPFDFMLEFAEEDERLVAAIEYNTELFDASTIDRMAAHWLHTAAQAVNAPATRPLSDLMAPAEAELERVLGAEWSGAVGPGAESPVVDEFAARVTADPDAIAVVCGERALSYGELDAEAGRLARVLVARGVRSESRVGLLLGRSADVVVAMLAVLKAGAAYVPLNAGFPDERLRQVV